MAEKTKSRTREVRASALVPEYWCGDHIVVGHMQSQDEHSSSKTIRETITYGVGNAFNRCTHSALDSGFDHSYFKGVGQMVNDTWHVQGFRPEKDKPGRPPACTIVRRGGPTGYRNPAATVELSVDPGLVALRRMQAWNRLMQLRPARSMNVARSVLELKDSEQTMGQALSFLSWARSVMGRKVHTGRKSYAVLSLGSKLATVASAYLWYQFGVEPTVSDIRKFFRELGQCKFRAFGELGKTHCLAKKGEVLVARYSALMQPSDILDLMFGSHRPESLDGQVSLYPPYTSTYVTWPAPGLCAQQVPLGRKVRISGEVRGCYFARAKEDVNISGLDNLRRHWRWNFPGLETVWELTPFSFLVDWVVGVGETIRALETRYLVEDYSASLGAVWQAETVRSSIYEPVVSGSLTVSPGSPAVFPYDYGKALISGSIGYSYSRGETRKSFTRRPAGAPTVVWPTLTRRISAGQLTSGMALLLQAAKAWM